MLTASVENMLVTSIDTTLETGVVPTQYIVIICIFYGVFSCNSTTVLLNLQFSSGKCE